ncbi:zinc knuckle CX2CX4HX4C containing protein [Tanacetum coccineum]
MINKLAEEYMDHIDRDKRKNEKTSGRSNVTAKQEDHILRLISDEELEYVEPLDGEAEQVTNIVQRTLCSPKVSDSSQRNKILQTKCLVNEKICSIIIDEGSCENLMSKELVKAFKLPTEPHLSPYQIGWIKKGSALKLTEICKIPLAIGKHYNELVTCDFVDMETCHVLLERPWKQDVDATHQDSPSLRMSNTSDKGTSFGDGAARVVLLLDVPLSTVDDFAKKLINDIEAGKHDDLIILKKWSMDTRLLKEELTRIPIWVKLHDVPIQVFEEDGISLIATFIGKPVMLDSYTSSMCNDSWGRSSFARCLIEVNSEADLVDVVTIGIPSLSEDNFTKETICVEYEWRPPRSDTCKIFGHVHDYCLNKMVSPPIVATSNVVTPNAEKTNDGFQTVGKTKKRKGKSKSTNGEEEEDVENVYDESANLIQNTKAGGSSSFTAAAG